MAPKATGKVTGWVRLPPPRPIAVTSTCVAVPPPLFAMGAASDTVPSSQTDAPGSPRARSALQSAAVGVSLQSVAPIRWPPLAL